MKKGILFLGVLLIAATWAGAAFIGSPPAQMGVSGANLYVAWTAAPDGVSAEQIHLRRSQDGGSHWLPEQVLAGESASPIFVNLQVSGPSVYIIYSAYVSSWYEVHLIASQDRGRSWNTPARLSTPGSFAVNPKIVVLGSTVIAFWEQSSQIYYVRSTNSGVTWTVPQTLCAQSGLQDTLFAAVDGQRVTVAYERASGSAWYLEYNVSPDGGSTWLGPTDVFSINGSYATPVGMEMSWPNVGIFWRSLADNQIRLSRSTNGGLTWSPGIQATNVTGPILSPSTSHTGASIFLAYADPPIPIETSIYLERSVTTGLTWKPAKLLSPAGRDCTGPRIVANGSQVWLCYWDNVFNSMGLGLTLYVRKSNDKGVTWQTAKAIATAQIYL